MSEGNSVPYKHQHNPTGSRLAEPLEVSIDSTLNHSNILVT
jgi:hypothetical protein